MPAGVQARYGRYQGPKWASEFPDTPEGFQAMHAHGEARKLPRETDPDTIDDPDVREAFLNQLQDEEDAGPSVTGRASSPARGRAATARRGGRRPASPRPTLTPPRRLSVSDGTGFALGLILYAVGLNYLRYGKDGVKAFFLAKFLNRENTIDPTQTRDLRHLLRPPTTPAPAAPPLNIYPNPGPTPVPSPRPPT